MFKRIAITVVGLLLIIAALAGTKVSQFGAMMAQAKDMKPPAMSVATSVVKADAWQPTFDAVGSAVPTLGVVLHAEAVGRVKKILFDSGAQVKAGDALVLLDTSVEQAQLESAAANAELGRTSYARVASLRGSAAIADQAVESANATSKQANAEVSRLNAEIGKRTVRAPFGGALGIWPINLGQFLNVGDPINSIVALQPMFVDFTLPQQRLSQLASGMIIRAHTDAFPDEVFEGKLTTVGAALDSVTRSVQLRATFTNENGHIHPGMFLHVEVVLPQKEAVLAIPVTAVIYAPYGDSVFVVEEKTKGTTTVRQQFVRLGTTRGDFVAVTQGVKGGQVIVSTGAFKLRNDMEVAVNNELKPAASLTPKPPDN